MGDSIHIQQMHVLADLKVSLHRFGMEAGHSLEIIEGILNKIGEVLKSRLLYDKRELESCIQMVRDAQNALDECESQEDDDYTPDCSFELEELQNARSERRRAEVQLNITQRYSAQVEKQFYEYRVMAARLKTQVNFQFEQAKAMLHSCINHLEKYKTIQSESQNYNFKEGSSFSELKHPISSGKWVERGILDFEINKIESIEGVSGGEDFKKMPMAEMEASLKRFLEIKKTIDSGKGLDKDFWAKIDREKGLDYPDGYLKVYEAFYGNDPIRITKDGENYTIESGRHRIWLAKKMGIRTLPVSIVERKIE